MSWSGYKLHLNIADCDVRVAALLSAASVHNSRAAIPLSLIRAQPVTNLHDVVDAATCSNDLRAYSRSLGHVPQIDHNPSKGPKIAFSPAKALRPNEHAVAERSNVRLKDEFGANHVMVQRATKVMGHLIFVVLVLSADPFAGTLIADTANRKRVPP